MSLAKKTSGAASAEPRHFDAGGELLLLRPEALEQPWPPFCAPVDPECPGYQRDGALAIVQIDGPLDQRGSRWGYWDGYDTLVKRTCAALQDPAVSAVALRINSPGGVVAGCFEMADLLLKAKVAAGKKLLAIVDECAASAAYAIACVADEILLPPSGLVGSVGVIAAYANYSGALKEAGVRVVVLTSGKQKADGSPYRPWSDEAVARMQADVDYLAGLFCARVATARGMTPEDVRALEAGCFRGQAAVDAHLADRVMPTADALAYAHALAKQASAASNPVFAVTRTAAQGTNPMKLLALALGLSEDATESEILAAIHAMKANVTELLALCGKTSMPEAIGAVRGLVATKASHDQLVASLEADKETARKAAVESIFSMAVQTGKRTATEIEAARASMKAGTLVLDTDDKVAAYKAEIEASPARYPGRPAASGQGSDSLKQPVEGALVGKNWEDMKPMERDALYRQNQAAYNALKTDWEQRGRPTSAKPGAKR
jgi:capsid assembly protease